MTDIEGGLISLEYAREGLNWKAPVGSDADADADLITYVQAATPMIESLVGPVLPVTVTKRFDGGSAVIVLPARVNAVTAVTESGEAATDFFYDADAGLLYGGTYDGLRNFVPGFRNVEVTYTVGFAEIPVGLQVAARELVRIWWQQRKQSNRPAYDDAPAVSVPMGFAMPKSVIEACQPWAQIPGFA